MLGLNLRREFQGPRLRATAIELANENNTGADPQPRLTSPFDGRERCLIT
jgi:hypothetical protein